MGNEERKEALETILDALDDVIYGFNYHHQDSKRNELYSALKVLGVTNEEIEACG